MDQNACGQAAIQQIQTTVKTLSSNMTAFNGVLDTGAKVSAAGDCPGQTTVPADHCRTAEPVSQDAGTFGNIF